jgi:hypothetical protein
LEIITPLFKTCDVDLFEIKNRKERNIEKRG